MSTETTSTAWWMDPHKLAVTLFVVSEATFFGFLIVAYIYFHRAVTSGPTAGNSLDPVRSGIFTVFLLASSFTVLYAERQLKRGRSGRFAAWLAVTIALGVVFLVGQGREYLRLYAEQVTVSRNIFGTTFFTLTGFHGLHVLLGVLALCVLLVLWIAGEFREGSSSAVESVAIYWHFVDWVWVVIFSVVYIWPHA